VDLSQIAHLFTNPWTAIVGVLAVVVQTAPDAWVPHSVRRWIAVLACAPLALVLGQDVAGALFSAALGLSGSWLLVEVVEAGQHRFGKQDEEPPPLLPPPPHVKAMSLAQRREAHAAAHDFLARVAYEAYNAARGGKAYDGSPIPGWDVVKPEIQQGWRVAVEAMLEHTLSNAEHESVTARLLMVPPSRPAS
jgi:hypothetical protein